MRKKKAARKPGGAACFQLSHSQRLRQSAGCSSQPLFSFLPLSFIYWFCLYEHYSHLLQKKWEFCIPIPFGIEEKKGPPLCKNALVHNGRVSPRREKNLPRFPDCPAIAPGSLGKPMGLGFPCNPEYTRSRVPFLSVGTFVFPIPCWIGGNDVATPLQKCTGAQREGRPSPREKSPAFSGLSRHRSGQFRKALGVWLFYAIRDIKHYSHLFSLRRGRE